MTDAQIIAVAITFLAVMGGTLFNNSRIGDIHNRLNDVKEVLRAELKAQRAETDARLAQFEARIDGRFSSMDRKLDELLRIVAEHDTKLQDRTR